MAKEIVGRELKDANGQVFYPYTDIEFVSGIPDDIADISSVQNDVQDLQAIINSIPVFGSTGWMNINFLNGTSAFDAGTTPQVQLMTIGDVRFMSVRGSFKGLTSDNQTIGQLPSSIVWAITKNVYFSQSMTTESGKAMFAAMKLSTNGVISIEESTRSTITTGTWLSCDWTFML